MTDLRAWLAIALLLVAGEAGAQTILGVVYEDGTRTPVRGAEVALLRADRVELQRVVTDTAGLFRLRAATAGAFQLRVRHLAYAAFESEPVSLKHGETASIEVRLAATSIPLEPLVVRVRTTNDRLAGFHERRLTQSFGRFLTREEIDRRSSSKTTDLMRGFPGVAIVPVLVRGRIRTSRYTINMRGTLGNCEPAIYIDGMRVTQSAESTIDDVLSPTTLEGVEVYNSNAGAPARYVEQGACGVVLFWTRAAEGGSTPWNWKRLLVGAGAVVAVLLLAR